MKKREITFPTILGILVALGGLAAGIWLLRDPLRTLVGASAEETPQSVRLTNITDTSFVVSWTTGKSTSGFVQYAANPSTNPDLVVSDDRDQEKGEIGSYFTHLVTVRGLKASTGYSFRIGSGKSLYDQQGSLYQVSTGTTLRNPPAADVTYGQVNNAAGEPAEGAIVYISLTGVVPQATLVKSSGSWVIPLSTARTTDLGAYAAYDKQTSSEDIFVQAGPAGTATVSTTTSQDSPVANITLGQVGQTAVVDTTPITQTPNITGPTPTPITITQTQTTDAASKFSAGALGPATEATSEGTLTLLTPVAGEKVNTDKPVIMGTAPKNAKVTIEIHSDAAITTEVRADANGNFEYAVPQNLDPGTHTITISSIVNGVVKKVTKSFVVEAAGESVVPAKTATPSGTLKPSPTPTTSPKPSPTPTGVPRVTIPSTASGVPVSGDLTPTLLLLILGVGLVFVGSYSYIKL